MEMRNGLLMNLAYFGVKVLAEPEYATS